MYENYLQVIVRDSAAAKRLSDLQGMRFFGAARSGAAATSGVLFEAAGLRGRVDTATFRLKDALARLADGSLDALVWSGGVPTPAIADLNAELPLRILDISSLVAPMSDLAGYPYIVRSVPTGGYVPPGIRSIGVPDLLLCRHDIAVELVAAVVDVLATDAPQLVPPYVRGLQSLAAPSMIQTGLIRCIRRRRRRSRAARLTVNCGSCKKVRDSSGSCSAPAVIEPIICPRTEMGG